MDVLTPKQRSYNMSQIRSKNTKPELLVFTELEKIGVPFQKHFNLPGKPDVAFPDLMAVLFIDGEFWHGRYCNKIRSRLSQYWIKKIQANKKRDKKINKMLRSQGWTVIRIWDDDLKDHFRREINKVKRALGIL